MPSTSSVVPLPFVRTWLIDGFNVLHAVLLGGLDSLGSERRKEWWTAPARQRLLDRVHGFEDPKAEIWVVFDGPRELEHSPEDDPEEMPTASTPRIHPVFAPSADAWLVRRVRLADVPEEIAVVTADRKVADRCRHAGAEVAAPRAFLAHCRGPLPRVMTEPQAD